MIEISLDHEDKIAGILKKLEDAEELKDECFINLVFSSLEDAYLNIH